MWIMRFGERRGGQHTSHIITPFRGAVSISLLLGGVDPGGRCPQDRFVGVAADPADFAEPVGVTVWQAADQVVGVDDGDEAGEQPQGGVPGLGLGTARGRLVSVSKGAEEVAGQHVDHRGVLVGAAAVQHGHGRGVGSRVVATVDHHEADVVAQGPEQPLLLVQGQDGLSRQAEAGDEAISGHHVLGQLDEGRDVPGRRAGREDVAQRLLHLAEDEVVRFGGVQAVAVRQQGELAVVNHGQGAGQINSKRCSIAGEYKLAG